jgi:5'-3' exonuclease
MKSVDEVDEELVRHMVVNSIRIYRNKFHNEYGELVLSYDGGKYWRRDVFEHYKGQRKVKQKQDSFDWNKIFGLIGKIREEIEEIFPYKSIYLKHIEADDIIAILTKHFHTTEKIMIVSSDKDFQQLQRYENVFQYSLKNKGLLVCKDPEDYLTRHIIKGDSSDGIPNILSDDDVFMDKDKRQKPCGVKKISKIMEELSEWTSSENWERNQTLVDFNKIPNWVEDTILKEWEEPIKGNRNKLFNYFIINKLKILMENIQEF